MKQIMMMWLIAVLWGPAEGQILTTAETLGKGKSAMLFSENRLFVDDVQLNIAYLQYIRGMSKRFDFYASVGSTRILRQNQAWIGIGGNYHLFQAGKAHVSSFNVISLPFHRRSESSTVLWNSAVVVSRNVTEHFTFYSGVNGLFPIGARERGLFTPPTRKVNVPLGLSCNRGAWALFAEADIGKLKAVGIGIGWIF